MTHPVGDGVPSSTSGKRERILQAALELFADRGFHGTAVPLVADRAGVGAGTLYRYFESKEALVNALYRHWKRAMTRALIEDFPEGVPTRRQFHVLWDRLCAFERAHPRALAFLELHYHAPYLDEASRRLDEELLSPLRTLLVKAQEQGIVKALPADALIALVFGAFVRLVKVARDGLVELTSETLQGAEECLWAAIRAV